MTTVTGLRAFNKRFFNPLVRNFAGKFPGPFVLVTHIGRKSGKEYKTPIIALRRNNTFIIALTYGTHVDWYQNVLAANHCQILWHGKNYDINKIEPISQNEGLTAFGFPFRPILKKRGVKDFAQLKIKN